MRNALLSAGLAVALAQVGLLGPALDNRLESEADSDAQALADFQSRVQRYVALHRELEGSVPTVAISDDWTTVKAAIEALATKIREARKDAKRGDIFAPEIERWFRRTLAECLQGGNTEALLATLNEENPRGMVLTPRINGRWPEEASIGPMPPHLLASLPQLPDELQYRFMNRDLILWDAHANVIVDFIKKAMP